MWNISPLEWGARFKGEGLTGTKRKIFRPVPEDFDRWATLFAASPIADKIMPTTESAKDFFEIERDLAILIPKNEQMEAFYTMKNGFGVPDVPAAFIYFAKQIFAEYRIGNLIGPCMPYIVSADLGYTNYFGKDYTGYDVINSYVYEGFQPVTADRPMVKCGDWYEAYIPSTDMVAALPESIASQLSIDDLNKVELDRKKGLVIEGKPLLSLADKVGEGNGIFDLR